jgi:2-polyprenyl-3-methyl-5-hydroxy-6-metoxy-1,4-benzoquinol methylase
MSCTFCKSSIIEKKIKTYKGINYNICGKCSCHYQDPVIKTDYISDSYWTCETDPDGNQRRLIDERENKIKNWYGDAVNFTNKFKDIDVLDFGCGLGFYLSALNKDIRKYGVEESQFAKNFIKKNFPDINIIQGGEEKLKDDKQFDIVFCHHVIEHVDDPLKLFLLLKRKLKKKGILILATPIVDSFLSNYFGGNFRHYIPEHITLFSLDCLKNLLFKNSFKILKIEKPYFNTEYFTFTNVMRLFNPKKLSPPYRGSIMTIYAQLKD